MKTSILLTVSLGVLAATSAHAIVRYVDANSASPTPPYIDWATAATTIQDAIDAAEPGDEIVVTNGTYATAGRAVGTNVLVNRVAVDKPLTLRSVNGPQFTVIQGYQVPGTTNGDGAIRCVYLTNGVSLSGFTLTKGATRSDGDWGGERSGGGLCCESPNAVVSNCVLVANSADAGGGGAYGGTMNNCTLTGNSASWGGGAYGGTLNNCTLTGNSAEAGGGASGGTLNNCTLTVNWAFYGGGAAGGTLNNCIVCFNMALTGTNYNDGLCYSDYETSVPVMNYCCTTPMPTEGVGNITLDPQLASATYLSAASPCRGAGSAAYTTGVDIDGEAWASPPSIGCDEYHAGAVTGPLSVGIVATLTNVATGYPVGFTALVDGRTTASVWGFGDGLVASNLPYASHAWVGPGNYTVILRAYNESHAEGVSATVTVQVAAQAVHYVAADAANPVPPYTSWATAATNIQDAVDVASTAGALVLVTNGVYATGGRAVGTNLLVNRVAVDKLLTVRSVNGPQFTVIQGCQVPGTTNGGAIRCVYLTNGAGLSGFTLTNGATLSAGDYQHDSTGGGAWCESWGMITNCVLSGNCAEYGGGAYGGTLNNCTLTGNSASARGGGAYQGTLNNCTLTGNSAYGGGGAAWGTMNHCVLTGNSAHNFGGGAYGGTLNNCTLTGNSADNFGGGASGGLMAGGTLNNCIVYFNTAQTGANYYTDVGFSIEMNYCCTTPLPAGGTGNITLDPQLASASHLSTASPCRGAGSAAYATGLDIDGEVWGSPPSIGCDEYRAGAVAGPLSVGIVATLTNVTAGFPLELIALIDGRTTASGWEFGDGRVASNQPYASHAWAAPGDYAVILRAYNESHAEGVSATVTVHVVGQPVHYVAADAANPLPPYTSWATAARNIQDAVDVASTAGALVLVTNGIYTAGGRAVGTNVLINRVAVDKPLTVRSVNGPQFTVIHGGLLTGEEIRCVYLASGASLSGFTLTNGTTRSDGDYQREQSGGGLWCEGAAMVSNCVLSGNSAEQGGGGGTYGGTLNNCTLTGNSASYGGGANDSTLNNCTLTGNSARDGGGAAGSTLNRCKLTDNSAASNGGGVYGGGLNNCTLNNCILTGNSARLDGGGAYGGLLQNCTLTDNSAGSNGGGANGGTLNNCTLTGNSAGVNGGGAYGGALNRGVLGYTLNNCIVYFNRAPNGANYWESTFTYSCTTPLPLGPGNIDADPQLASSTHLSPLSPCIGAGSPAYATGVDIDGEAWATPPSIGCDEYHAGAVTGPLSVGLVAAFTNVAVGFPLELTALIDGRTTARVWEFGDGRVASNQPYATHAWTAPGDYAVILRAYNESHAEGVSATVTVHVVAQPVHYVAADAANPLPPYTSWATAAWNIQDAVDVASTAGALVLVTDGIYTAGGRAGGTNVLINRVAVDKPLTVRSVNGPEVTVIEGAQPNSETGEEEVRCAYVGDGSVLSGFTLTNGRAEQGGGVWSEYFGVITNCVIANSAASNGGGAHGGTLDNCVLSGNSANTGGGASGCTLSNCTLTDNSASYGGGGAIESTLNNCTLTGNSAGSPMQVDFGWGGGAFGSTLNNCVLSGNSAASQGGGAWYGTLNNCIAYFNTAPGEPNCANGTLNYCCTTPLPQPWQGGSGNITNAPLFVDYEGGDLRLQSNSPCINAGNNAYAPGTTDLDGLPRIVSGTVDIGAYEFQGSGSVISYAWLQQYGLPTDGSADVTDSDADGLNTWQEWRCLTDPINALSVLLLLPTSPDGSNVTVRWQSVAGVDYFLERSTDLSATPPFTPLVTSLPGQAGSTSYTDTNAAMAPRFFYRVGVGN